MRVYQFMNALHGVSNLSLQRLRISRFGELNDPFELLAADLLDPRDRRAIEKFKRNLDAERGLLCFSKDWKNPLLWGHYGDKHKGLALGFDIPDELLFEVKYKQERTKPKFDSRTGMLADGEKFLEQLIATKYSDWAYESEFRRIIELDRQTNEGGSYFVKFSGLLELREVILGYRCDLSPSSVSELLKNRRGKIWVMKTKLALRKFGLTEDREQRSRIS